MLKGGQALKGAVASSAGAATRAVKSLPRNPWGRRGSPAHVAKIGQAEEALRLRGFSTVSGGSKAERAVDVGGGRIRFPDLVMSNADGKTIAVQVGRRTIGGQPVAREARAMVDLRGTGNFDHVFFLEY
jgi:hypothetical protein